MKWCLNVCNGTTWQFLWRHTFEIISKSWPSVQEELQISLKYNLMHICFFVYFWDFLLLFSRIPSSRRRVLCKALWNSLNIISLYAYNNVKTPCVTYISLVYGFVNAVINQSTAYIQKLMVLFPMNIGHTQVRFCSLKLLATHKEFQCVRHQIENLDLFVICKNPYHFCCFIMILAISLSSRHRCQPLFGAISNKKLRCQ